MTKYKFDEIAINSTQKKKPTEEDKVYYIGLEHIDPGCFDVVRWGSDVAPTGDKLLMQKGDVLFGKRRAYQRKVAIAPFDGIFSAHGMVLRPNLKVIDANYFPFFISSDKFMETAVRISVGGLSPTINWKDLARQEFELPSLDEQKVLADKLWAAYRLKEAYKKLLVATDEMVKSQFIEMYYNTHNKQTLESVCPIMSKGITPKYVESSSVLVINQACIHWDGQRLGNIKYHNEEIPVRKRILESGDVLLNATGNGTLGRCCVFICPSDNNIYINDGHVIALSTDRAVILPEVLNTYLSLNDTQAEIYRQYVTGSTNQVDIVFSDIKKMKVPVPSMDEQILFVEVLTQADKSKFGDFKSQFIEMFGGLCQDTPWSDVVTITNGKAYPEEYQEEGAYPICGSGGIMCYGEKKLCNGNTTILGRKGNINNPIFMESGYWIVDTAFSIDVDKAKLHPKFFYYWCCQYDFTKLNKQGVLPSLTRKDLEKVKMAIPQMRDQLKFVSIAEQADKSKSVIQKALVYLNDIQSDELGKIA